MYVFYSLMKQILKGLYSLVEQIFIKKIKKKWIHGNIPMKDSTFNGVHTIIFQGRVLK